MATDPAAAAQVAASVATTAQSGIRWGDIIALVGAAAWLPQIWRALQRPKVTPIVGGQIEIGFTQLGPLFNPKIAFRVERRVALVTGIAFRITHERGQSTAFRCVQLVETGAHSESTSGEKAIHNRLQDVVAIVLNPMAIVERKVNSREVKCIGELETRTIRVYRAVDRLRRADRPAWIDDLQNSPEYVEIAKFVEDAFIWQAGTYRVECSVTVAGQSHPSTCNFKFVVGEGTLASLRENLGIMRDNFLLGLSSPEVRADRKPRDYHWAYPYVVVDDEAS